MFSYLRYIGLSFALWPAAAAPELVICSRFEKIAAGDAYRINSCQTYMNVDYCLK